MMLGFSCSRLALRKTSNTIPLLISNVQLGILHFQSLLSLTSLSSQNLNGKSFTVSYLINSCGLTPHSADSVFKKVRFESPEKPDTVLAFLKNHGFTSTHISKIVRQRPKVLLAHPETLLLPNIEFLRSVGVSSSDLSLIVSRNPEILFRSLDKYLVPRYEILKSVLVCNEKVIKSLKHMSVLSMKLLLKNFDVNLSLLRQIGVSQSSIDVLVMNYPFVMCVKADKFGDLVQKVMDMRFESSKVTFVRALHVFFQMTDELWVRRMEVYKKWGFSEDEIFSMFRKNPTFMIRSGEKVISILNFLVCRMGWQIADVVSVPVVLSCSLEGRIIPRCFVARVLLLKGLISKADVSLFSLLMPSDEHFLEWFVIKHQEHVPQLSDLFHAKIGLEELGFGFDEKLGIMSRESL
ncbi:uncharacterized protein LOC126664779 [Mercurialis annua]|uniref:uncharacterized protein LOC126664779 n=1 Tax=Mercurialis annua TaxID=3986 RepID=UPI00215F814B|nr:uncharacterized protein LOC126664779 [Mercurialis annua]